MGRPKGDQRDRLLDATMGYIAENGVGDLTLRQLAPALETSHRMLIYHFGSKDGLLVDVVRRFDEQNRAMAARITGDESLSPVETLRATWRLLSDPALAPFQRLFTELYGQALQGQPHAAGLPQATVESWLGAVAAVFRRAGVPARSARDEARLVVAVTLGLMMDLLATGDRRAVNRSYERFVSRYEEQLPS